MIASIGSSEYNYEESLTTLRYTNRANNIKNQPGIDEELYLKEQQDKLNDDKRTIMQKKTINESEYEGMLKQLEEQKLEIEREQEERQTMNETYTSTKEEVEDKRVKREKLSKQTDQMVARPVSATGDRRSASLFSQSNDIPEIARFKVFIIVSKTDIMRDEEHIELDGKKTIPNNGGFDNYSSSSGYGDMQSGRSMNSARR